MVNLEGYEVRVIDDGGITYVVGQFRMTSYWEILYITILKIRVLCTVHS